MKWPSCEVTYYPLDIQTQRTNLLGFITINIRVTWMVGEWMEHCIVYLSPSTCFVVFPCLNCKNSFQRIHMMRRHLLCGTLLLWCWGVPWSEVSLKFGLVCWSLTSLCHSKGHIETMPAREINPFASLTRIRSQFLMTQWRTIVSEWTRLRLRPLSHRGWRFHWSSKSIVQ